VSIIEVWMHSLERLAAVRYIVSDRHFGQANSFSLTDVGLIMCTCCALPTDGRGAPRYVAGHGRRNEIQFEAEYPGQVTVARARHTLRRGWFLPSWDGGIHQEYEAVNQLQLTCKMVDRSCRSVGCGLNCWMTIKWEDSCLW
jgi:hypothetical protein